MEILNAASSGDRVTLERLFLSGVDMNTSDYDYRTALHLAVCENHVGCIKYLIETCKVDLNSLVEGWVGQSESRSIVILEI